MNKRPFFIAAFSFAAGISVSILSDIPFQAVLAAGLLFLAFVFLKLKRAVFLLPALIFVLGFMLANTEKAEAMGYHDENGGVVEVSGRIAEIRERTSSRLLVIDNVCHGDIKKKMKLAVVATDRIYAGKEFRYGENVWVTGEFTLSDEAGNYGCFDERSYYLSNGIAGEIFATGIYENDDRYDIVADSLYRLNKSIKAVFDEVADEKVRAVFASIFLGDKSMMSAEDKDVYQEAGIAHVLAISGLHVSAFGMMIMGVLRRFLKTVPAAAISVFLLLLFVVMSGAHVSALRALIMFLMSMVARCTGKTYDLLSALSFAAILLLADEPYYIINTGFILSFGAVFALAVWGIILEKYIDAKNRLLNTFLAGATATMLTLPVVADMYHQVPLYAVLINLVVIPLMTPVLMSAAVSGLAGLISLNAAVFTAGAGVYIVYLIEIVSRLCLGLPNAVITTGSIGILKLFAYYAIFILFMLFAGMLLKKKRSGEGCRARLLSFIGRLSPRKRRMVRFISVIIIFASMFIVIIIKPVNRGLDISFFDVGQGDGILIRNEDTVYMIDGGSGSIDGVWRRCLETALKNKGVTEIDHWIVTHPDTDHIGGLIEALKDDSAGRIGVENILIPYIEENENEAEMLLLAGENEVKVSFIHVGMYIKDGGLEIDFIHPGKEFESDEANEHSAVCELRYKGFKALFTGDIGFEQEKILVDGGLLERCHLLKVAHHGSKYSSSEEFLALVQPDISVISAGMNNLYGHPADETLKRLKDCGSEIYDTRLLGEIDVSINEILGNTEVWISSKKQAPDDE